MADDDQTIQHTPTHEEGQVFDRRHPAASSFAVAQPGAGVVSDDADAKGQNLAGGPTAAAAEQAYADQGEVLQQNYQRDLRVGAGLEPEPSTGGGGTAPETQEPTTAAGATGSSSDSSDDDEDPPAKKTAHRTHRTTR